MLQTKIFKVSEEKELNDFLLKNVPEGITFQPEYIAVQYDDGQPTTDIERRNTLRIQVAEQENRVMEAQTNYSVSHKMIQGIALKQGEDKITEDSKLEHEKRKIGLDHAKIILTTLKNQMKTYEN